MNKRLFISFLLLSIWHTVPAQKTGKRSLPLIHITAIVPDSLNEQTDNILEVVLYPRFSNINQSEWKIIPLKKSNDKFSALIEPDGEFCYVEIHKIITNGPSLKRSVVMLQRGDSVSFHWHKDGSINFSGRGAAKLNLQLSFATVIPSWGGIRSATLSSQMMEYWKKLTYEHLSYAKRALDSVRSTMDQQTFNILSTNVRSEMLEKYVEHLTPVRFPVQGYESTYLPTVKKEMENIDIIQRGMVTTDSIVLRNSFRYTRYLATFETRYCQLMLDTADPPIETLFERIISKYDGIIRDRVLAHVIKLNLDIGKGMSVVPKALSLIKDPDSRKFLEHLAATKSPGAVVPEATFVDLQGKRVDLSSFKGKVVFIESYFEGCAGCIGLASRMHQVTDYFAGNPNVVFISLSVDKDRVAFLRDAASGQYGSTHSIYLNTNGLGDKHPFCKHFNYVSFPNTLLIDKNGKVISAERLDPLTEARKGELIKLIERNI